MSTADVFEDIKIDRGMPFETYYEMERLNASGMKMILRAPARYLWCKERPEDSAALLRGRALHALVLEGRRDYVVFRGVRRGKDWEAFEAAHSHLMILRADEAERIETMAQMLRAHDEVMKLLRGDREVVLTWTDKITGVPCKARLDVLGDGWVADLKTAADGTPQGFARAAANYMYHLQAALYMDAAAALLGKEDMRFIFVVIEPEPPHPIGLYELDQDAVDKGRLLYRNALERYAYYREAGWPTAHCTQVETIALPPWA